MKDEILNKGVYPVLDGNSRMCPLWADDIGRVASTVLSNPEKFKSKSYYLTGPEPLTMDEKGKVCLNDDQQEKTSSNDRTDLVQSAWPSFG